MYIYICTPTLLNYKLILSQTLKGILQKKKKKSENTAINDAAKIGAPNNHLNSRLDLWSV